ncbi:MAG: hypothetical protein ACAI38_24760 [Myxococcota bacterium]|nr:hypothetical protein [Myxococcota bacterium]
MARNIALLVVCLVLGVTAYALVASCFVDVDCGDPVLSSLSPEGTDSLAVCRRPMLIAMPGQGSDASGWVVLRDARAFITGITDVSMVQNAADPEWFAERVDMKLTASFPRKPPSPTVQAWLTDRCWRMRAVLGLTPSDASYR